MSQLFKTNILVSLMIVLGSLFTILPGAVANAAQEIPAGCPGATVDGPREPGTVCPESKFQTDCVSETINSGNCKIINWLAVFTRVLSGIVGVVIVIMIAIGGVQFSMARDNPQAVAAARGRIINALIALVFYIFSFAILQWLIPGGIL